jgi:hypothetical protein
MPLLHKWLLILCQSFLEWLMHQSKDEYRSHQKYFQVDRNKQLLDEEDMQKLLNEFVLLILILIWQKSYTIQRKNKQVSMKFRNNIYTWTKWRINIKRPNSNKRKLNNNTWGCRSDCVHCLNVYPVNKTTHNISICTIFMSTDHSH